MNKFLKLTLFLGVFGLYGLVYAQTADEASAGGVGVIIRDLLITGGLLSTSLMGAFGALVPRLGLGVAVEGLLIRSAGSFTLPTNPAAVALTVVGMVLSFGILYEGGDEQSFLSGVPGIHGETKIFRESVNNLFAGDPGVSQETGEESDTSTAVSDTSSNQAVTFGGDSASAPDPEASNPVPSIPDPIIYTPPPSVDLPLSGVIRIYVDGTDDRKVSYEEALAKAKTIADGITAQIVSQFPQAKSVTDVVSPIIAEKFAEMFSDGTFYDHTFDTLKKLIYDIIKAEIDKQYSDPNSNQAATGIADQIATQMAQQFIADPQLDAVELTLKAKRNRLVYDQDVLDVISKLKELQNAAVKYIPHIFNGEVDGLWEGSLKAPAYQGCPAFASDWKGTWYESEKRSSVPDSIRGNYFEVYGNFGGSNSPFSKGLATISGSHFARTTDGSNFRFQLYSTPSNGVKKALFTGMLTPNSNFMNKFDNSVNGKFIAVCPTNSKAGTAGTFTGRRLSSVIIGPWKGTFTVKEPAACATKVFWSAQLSEFSGDVFGMFTAGEEKYEARGIYNSVDNETIWIAGDYAFLGLIKDGRMTGTMLGPDCPTGTNSAGGKDRQGIFEADLGDRNLKYPPL